MPRDEIVSNAGERLILVDEQDREIGSDSKSACHQGSGILQTLQNYGYDIVLLIALLVVASMFVGVCYHAYTRYSEIHTGRATWGQFGLTVAVGAILLVVGIWLLTKATGVL